MGFESKLLGIKSDVIETTLSNLGSAQSAGVGAERVLMGAFANDVTSIILKSIPDTTHSAVWFGTVTSVNSAPSAALFPTDSIIVWNKVAS